MKTPVLLMAACLLTCGLISTTAVHAAAINNAAFSLSEGRGLDVLDALEEAKLLADDGMADDFFGQAVSLSGNRAAVGASYHDGLADNAGAVYVYEYDGSSWILSQKLTADDGAVSDQFGYAVSMDGDTLMVGAFRDDDNSGDSGSVYVFEYLGDAWTQTQKLIASDGDNSDWFGFAISLENNRAMIAANNDDDLGERSGSVYEFVYINGSWVEAQKLLASDGGANEKFGQSLSLSGNRLLVGAYRHQVNAESVGAAYVFEFDGENNNWVETQQLLSSEPVPDSYFGFAVSLSGDRALVGASQDTGNIESSGAAYMFAYDGQNWLQSQKFTVAEMNANGDFGVALDLHENRAVIGAKKENDNGSYSGAAYVYDFMGGSWLQTDKLVASDNNARDEFGVAISMSGGKALVGAYRDTEIGNNAGSAYVFNVPFMVSLQVSGLAPGNSVELLNNGGDALLVNDNGVVTFDTALFVGDAYAVTVASQPTSPNQTCVVKQGQGVLNETGVENINVVCVTTPYFVAGVVNGLLADNPLVLNNNGLDQLVVTQAGSFVFDVPVDDQQNYQVDIQSMPTDPIQPCEVIAGTGLIQGSDVDSVVIHCEPGDDLIFKQGLE